jgi:hypothetical protein
MFNRLTDSQKNFRKQMKEIEEETKQKQLNGDSEDQFYSYYKRDLIDNYYTRPSPKRRIFKGFSFVFLAFVLWNSYAIFTWINPVYRNVTSNDIPLISKIFDNKGVQHRETAKYLSSLGEANVSISNYSSDLKSVLNAIPKNLVGYKEKRIEVLEQFQMKLQRSTLALQQTDKPDFLNDFHVLKVEQANFAIQICTQLILAEKSKDESTYNKYIERYNELSMQYNQAAMKAQQELVAVFEKIGMDYQIDSAGVISYRYKQ